MELLGNELTCLYVPAMPQSLYHFQGKESLLLHGNFLRTNLTNFLVFEIFWTLSSPYLSHYLFSSSSHFTFHILLSCWSISVLYNQPYVDNIISYQLITRHLYNSYRLFVEYVSCSKFSKKFHLFKIFRMYNKLNILSFVTKI